MVDCPVCFLLGATTLAKHPAPKSVQTRDRAMFLSSSNYGVKQESVLLFSKTAAQL